MRATTTSDEPSLDRVVELIVTSVQPLRVVLFGSAVRGETNAGSDLDVMVVMPDGADRRDVARTLYLAMANERIGTPAEFHVTTPSILARLSDDVGYYHYDAVREGRDLYAA